MAQRVNVTLEDDLDGGKANETVRFGIDGVDYEIDLSTKNAKKLRDALAGYVDAGRKTPRSQRVARRRVTSRDESVAIRDWATSNGHEVSDRGRIPVRIREAYADAHA